MLQIYTQNDDDSPLVAAAAMKTLSSRCTGTRATVAVAVRGAEAVVVAGVAQGMGASLPSSATNAKTPCP